jgi:plastocyanin
MKDTNRLVVIACCCIGLVAIWFLGIPKNAHDTSDVQIKNGTNHQVVLTPTGYAPSELTIVTGDTVTFSSTTGKPHWPASNSHPDHTLYPMFDPKNPLATSETWTFTFEDPGSYPYHDHIRSYFEGIIVVTDDL